MRKVGPPTIIGDRYGRYTVTDHNTRANHMVVCNDGTTTTITLAAEKAGLTIHCVRGRINRGWTVDQALGLEARQ